MTKGLKKEVTLLKEYKEGFEEISKLVNSFDQIEFDSQEVFISARRKVLSDNLKLLQEQKRQVFLKVRSFLAGTNSEIKVLIDTESFINEQLRECEEFETELKAASEETGKDEKSV